LSWIARAVDVASSRVARSRVTRTRIARRIATGFATHSRSTCRATGRSPASGSGSARGHAVRPSCSTRRGAARCGDRAHVRRSRTTRGRAARRGATRGSPPCSRSARPVASRRRRSGLAAPVSSAIATRGQPTADHDGRPNRNAASDASVVAGSLDGSRIAACVGVLHGSFSEPGCKASTCCLHDGRVRWKGRSRTSMHRSRFPRFRASVFA